MFKQKITMDEFVLMIYSFGYNQYTHMVKYFDENEITIDNNQTFILCETIFTKLMEKVSDDNNYKITGNLTDKITKMTIDSIQNISEKDINTLKNYMDIVKDEAKELINDGNGKISDLVNYFLDEIIVKGTRNNNQVLFLVNLFSNWHMVCIDITKKYAIK